MKPILSTMEPKPPVDLCEHCKHSDDCTNLHVYYLSGAICTIIGSSFVIFSYLCSPYFRHHPSILIFMRCVFDLLFGICLVLLFVIPNEYLVCGTVNACDRLGPLMLFAFLCSNGYFAASIVDLYLSISNPFSSPHKLTKKLHGVVIIICITITLIVRYVFNDRQNGENSFSYRQDIQFCFVSIKSERAINPINVAFIYAPITVIILSAFSVNIYAFLRLRKGLPDTFAIRMRSVQDSFSYSVGFTSYQLALGMMYFTIWYQDSSAADSNLEFRTHDNYHIAFAILMGCLGINDVFLWYCRKFRGRKQMELVENKMMKMAELKMDESMSMTTRSDNMSFDAHVQFEMDKMSAKKKQQRSIKRGDLKNALIPDRPVTIYRAKSDEENPKAYKAESKWKKWFKNVSIKPNTKGNTINKALRREVLAYTTDGIAQSIERGQKLAEKSGFERFGPRERDFPLSMNEAHGPTIQRFGIYIKHNCQLLYSANDSNSIMSDSKIISMTACFGSNMKNQSRDQLIEIDPSTLRRPLNRVTTHDVSIRRTEYFEMGKKREFVDFAPLIFRYIRVSLLKISDKDYMKSIIPSTQEEQKKVLDAKFAEAAGKSGAFFYFTHDSRFLVKTLQKHEIELFIEILPDYVRHLKNNLNTILSRCVGLHSVNMYGLTMYYMVMENVFLADLKPHEIYDLKGSWVKRGTDHRIGSGEVMKDNDLKRFIILNEKNRKQILKQLDRDSRFLEQHNIMDYSLLLGIYHMKICTADKASRMRGRSYMSHTLLSDEEDSSNDDEDDDKYDDASTHSLFQPIESHNNYAGGVQAQVIEGPGIYYMGIIDALQGYTWKKRLETLFKTYFKNADGDGISCVEPTKYRKRFMNYMENIMINDNDYFHELEVKKKQLERQDVYVYPGKDMIDLNMKELRQKKFSLDENFLGHQHIIPEEESHDHLYH